MNKIKIGFVVNNLDVVEEQAGKQYQFFEIKGSIVKQSRISSILSKIELSNVNKGI